MTRLITFYSLALALSVIPKGLAGPGCAHKNYKSADCVEKCKERWGWSGSMMGTDRWGSVINKVEPSSEAWESTIAEACGSSATPISAPTGSSAPVVGAGSVPVQSATSSPTLTTSVPSVAVTSSVSSSIAVSVEPTPSATPASSVVSSIVSSSSRFITSVRQSPVTTQSPTTTEAPSITQNPMTTEAPSTTQAPTTQTPPPVTTSSPAASSGSGSGSTSASDIQSYLTAHNSIRANHGAAPLVWSDELASKAQQWANGCEFQHSGGSLGPYGENLAAGTGSSYGISQAIASWTNEVSEYNANNPQPSHFTQVVWKGSQQLGCAVQQCNGIFPSQYGQANYYVCEYFPQGNVLGQFISNVQV